jgi:hypothetical protein
VEGWRGGGVGGWCARGRGLTFDTYYDLWCSSKAAPLLPCAHPHTHTSFRGTQPDPRALLTCSSSAPHTNDPPAPRPSTSTPEPRNPGTPTPPNPNPNTNPNIIQTPPPRTPPLPNRYVFGWGTDCRAHSRDRRDGHKRARVQGDPSCADISCTHMPSGNAWEIALPDSLFDVRVTVGDPCYPSPQGTSQ